MSLTLVAIGHPTDALFNGRYDMAGDAMTIGRAGDNHWVVDDQKRMVSKRHCKIERRADGYRLTDTSTNGVTVNGRPVDKAAGTMLRHGDEMELGQYRFRIEIAAATDAEAGGDHILGDITPDAYDDPLAGEHRDAFEGLEPRGDKAPGTVPPMGWDGPPRMDDDIIKPADIIEAMDHEARNLAEQIPTDRIVIDLPEPPAPRPDDPSAGAGQAGTGTRAASDRHWDRDRADGAEAAPDADGARIPTDWWMDDETGATAPQAADDAAPIMPAAAPDPRPAPAGATQPRAPQAPPPAPPEPARAVAGPSSAAILTALADGLGVDPSSLSGADADRLLRNVGTALAIAVRQLQSLQVTANRAASVLETDQDQLGYTPWIFSLSGGDSASVVANLAGFLAEAEPRDLNAMKRDFEEIEQFVNASTGGAIALVDELQRALDPAALERQVSGAANMVPQLRKAALWDALARQSDLFGEPKGKSAGAIMERLIARIAAARREAGGR